MFWVVLMRERVFSWAQMVAPAECIHSLPSVWSKCQWVLMRTWIGSALMAARASVSWGWQEA